MKDTDRRRHGVRQAGPRISAPVRGSGTHPRFVSSRPMVAVLLVVVALVGAVLASWAAPIGPQPAQAAPARATSAQVATSGGEKVVAFEDVTIGPGENWNDVVVFGGDLTVEGTVNRSVVVIAGNATISSTANVGAALTGSDHSVTVVFGKLTTESGATIFGQTTDVAGDFRSTIRGGVVDPVVAPWRLGSIIGWIASTIGLAIIALIAIAIAPRQIAFVRNHLSRHPWSSLGWGALGAIVFVPLVSAVLVITVIGIIVAVPWLLIGVPWMFLFGFVSLGAMLGRLVLGAREDDRSHLIGAGVLGVVILNLLRWVPVAGAVILALLFMAGFGATYVSIFEWLRDRRRRHREIAMRRAAEAGQTWPYGPPGPGPAGPASGWSPPASGAGWQPPAAGREGQPDAQEPSGGPNA